MEYIAQSIAFIGAMYCLGLYLSVNMGVVRALSVKWYIHNLVGSTIILASNLLGALNVGSLMLEVCYICVSIYYVRRAKK